MVKEYSDALASETQVVEQGELKNKIIEKIPLVKVKEQGQDVIDGTL
jgi:hypothetical protein